MKKYEIKFPPFYSWMSTGVYHYLVWEMGITSRYDTLEESIRSIRILFSQGKEMMRIIGKDWTEKQKKVDIGTNSLKRDLQQTFFFFLLNSRLAVSPIWQMTFSRAARMKSTALSPWASFSVSTSVTQACSRVDAIL